LRNYPVFGTIMGSFGTIMVIMDSTLNLLNTGYSEISLLDLYIRTINYVVITKVDRKFNS